jgi:predicted transglutaminase-like cysteine proteinase
MAKPIKRNSSKLTLIALTSLCVLTCLAFELDQQEILEAVKQYGESAGKRLQNWVDLLNQNKTSDNKPLDELAKLDKVNRFFNKIPYMTDAEHWGVDDYWATPVQLIASNAGDCEDYAIAKYMSLVKLGIPEEKIRITYVKVTGRNQLNMRALLTGKAPVGTSLSLSNDEAHMVLTYYATPNAEPLILDNLKDTILAASQRSDLTPVYSFSGNSVWLINQWSGKEALVGGPEKLERWAKLQKQLRL